MTFLTLTTYFIYYKLDLETSFHTRFFNYTYCHQQNFEVESVDWSQTSLEQAKHSPAFILVYSKPCGEIASFSELGNVCYTFAQGDPVERAHKD